MINQLINQLIAQVRYTHICYAQPQGILVHNLHDALACYMLELEVCVMVWSLGPHSLIVLIKHN